MCTEHQPPNISQHLTNSHRPTSYYYFWAIGSICLLITCFLLIPRIHAFYKHAKQVRDERGYPLLPFSYVAMLIFVSFPVLASFGKFMILLSPFATYSVEFIMALTESIVLYSFTTLLIMYLGSNNLLNALQIAPKTKWKASPPIGCCFRPCIKPSTVTKQDFHRLYYCIIQYCILLPLFDFVIVISGNEGKQTQTQIFNVMKIISVFCCFYGLLALLRATDELLAQHGIHGKFWCIKGLILFMLIPPIIMGLISDLPEMNEEYDHHIMVEAWSSVISLVCLTGLSLVFLKHFKPQDALYAMHNAEKKDHNASKTLITVNQENVECHDQKIDNDEQTNIIIPIKKGDT